MTEDTRQHYTSFISHLKTKNYSPSTIKNYNGALRYFLQDIKDVRKVTRETLMDHCAGLMEQKNKGDFTLGTVCVKIRAIRNFFGYLEKSNRILVNPAERIKEPKQETALPRTVLSEDEMTKILEMPDLTTDIGIRDRTILEVLYSTGIRIGELSNLTIYDCDLHGGQLRINNGKGSKDRVVPLGRHAVRFLKEYITRVRPQHTRHTRTNRLITTYYGQPLTIGHMGSIVKRYAEDAGIEKKVTPHVFRHTFATQLIRNGADIISVQKMLGHAAPNSTQIYTRVAGIEVKKTHREKHPRERDKE